MNIGDLVQISPDNILPDGQPWRGRMEKLIADEAIGVIKHISGTEWHEVYKVEFIMGDAIDSFLFSREEIDYAPIGLLTQIEIARAYMNWYKINRAPEGADAILSRIFGSR